MSNFPVVVGEVLVDSVPEKSPSLPALRTDHNLTSARNPFAVLVKKKKSEHSRRSVTQALNKIAWYTLSHALIGDDDEGNVSNNADFNLPSNWDELSKKKLNKLMQLLGPAFPDDPKELCQIYPWENLEYSHTSAIQAALQEHYSPASANVMLSALRGVLKECKRLKLMTAEKYWDAVDIENVKKPQDETEPSGREIRHGERNALYKACRVDMGTAKERSNADVRDAAIIATLYVCGLRRSEIINLKLDDYDPTTGQLIVTHGKGGKKRTVYLEDAQEHFDFWLKRRGNQPTPYVFLPINKGDVIQFEQKERLSRKAKKRDGDSNLVPASLSAQSIYNMLKKRGEQAGLEDFTPHDFRRTYIGDLLDQGVDLSTVQKLAGHSDPKTTGNYDRRPESRKREATSKLFVPKLGAKLD